MTSSRVARATRRQRFVARVFYQAESGATLHTDSLPLPAPTLERIAATYRATGHRVEIVPAPFDAPKKIELLDVRVCRAAFRRAFKQ